MKHRPDHCSYTLRNADAHKQFIALLIVTSLIVVLFEIFLTKNVIHPFPPYGLQQQYITVLCFDGRGMGNVLFDYASLIGIAAENNKTAIMPKNFKLRNIFELDVIFVDNVVQSLRTFVDYEEFGRRSSAYDTNVQQLPPLQSVRLRGYYQSWRYFWRAEKEVRRQFTFKEYILSEAKEFLRDNTPIEWHSQSVVRIGIHVRRGDVLRPSSIEYGYTTPAPAYFKNAMNYLKRSLHKQGFSRIQFVVCSNDIDWCKKNIDPRIAPVVFSSGTKDYVDLAILSLCNHAIMSTGSFGWWSAWLANGTTIYYEKWPKEFSQLEYHVEKRDYFPPHWIPMSERDIELPGVGNRNSRNILAERQ